MKNKCYTLIFRNKMFGYKNEMILNKNFKSKREAQNWAKENKQDFIDRTRVVTCKYADKQRRKDE